MPRFDSSSTVSPWSISPDYRVAAFQGTLHNNQFHVWLDLNISYSFPEGPTYFRNGTAYGQKNEVGAGWSPLGGSQKLSVKAALDAWAAVSGIRFVEVDDDLMVGDLRFALTSAIPASSNGHAYSPAPGIPESGDVWITSRWAGQNFGTPPSQTSGQAFNHNPDVAIKYFTVLHEIGHALGLSHPFSESGVTRATAPLPVLEDSFKTTVMSYAPMTGILGAPYRGIPTTPMPYDILAVQHMYGANMAHNATDTVYFFDLSDVRLETIWDAGGNDTIVVTNRNNLNKVDIWSITFADGTRIQTPGHRGAQIDLRPGQGLQPVMDGVWGGQAGNRIGFIGDYAAKAIVNQGSPSTNFQFGPNYLSDTSNIFIAFHTWIENAIGTNGDDLLVGNRLNNRLTGGGGNDRIDGMEGIDTAVYSKSASSYVLTRHAEGINVRANYTEQLTGYPGTGYSYTINPIDFLRNVERLEFTDKSIAFDLGVSESAGKTARLVGALLDTAYLTPEIAGIGINLFDGGMSMVDIAQLILDHPIYLQQSAGGNSHTGLVVTLFRNIVDSAPTADDINLYVGMLNRGEVTQAQLAVMAAEHPLNDINIGLTGLQSTGLSFFPFVG